MSGSLQQHECLDSAAGAGLVAHGGRGGVLPPAVREESSAQEAPVTRCSCQTSAMRCCCSREASDGNDDERTDEHGSAATSPATPSLKRGISVLERGEEQH